MPDAFDQGGLAQRSVAEALIAGSMHLRASGIESPERDVRLLLAAALRCATLDLIKAPERRLTASEANVLAIMLARRAAREPVSRILGVRSFYGRDFAVSPATLDPRPDTETLVDLVLDAVAECGWRDRELRIVDVGTGSGCILLTLLAELPGATGLGIDISLDALETAGHNVRRLGLGGRVRLETGRSLETVAEEFDILVSNPPYIPSADIAGLAPEVSRYDPLPALDGGADGLGVYREIVRRLGKVVPDGLAAFEVGAGQATDLIEIIKQYSWSPVWTRRDLAGHERCVALWTRR